MHVPLALILAVCCAGLPAFAQGNDWLDEFSAHELDARWHHDVASGGSATVDPARQMLVLKGKDNSYNHIETDLPEDVSLVQADMNNVTDTSASWSPSLILYWGPEAYLRVMVSMHYGLRLEKAPGNEIVNPWPGTRPVPDTWYRLRVGLAADTVTVSVSQPGTELSLTSECSRLPEWQGPCRLILGKGYMPLQGGAPDFDNNYGRNTKTVTVYLDNVVVGQPADLEARLAASVAAAKAQGERDPSLLQVAVWPNVLSEQTSGRVWLAEGAYQRICLIYANLDEVHSAKRIRMELEISRHLAPTEVMTGTLAVKAQPTEEGDNLRLSVDFPEDFVLPSGFRGVDKPGGEAPGWLSWPISRMTPPVFIHCRPTSQAEGHLRARILSDGEPGPWIELAATVLPPLPPPPASSARHLGLSLWEGAALDPAGLHGKAALNNMLEQYRQVGLTRLHLGGNKPVFEAARALGIHANLMSWWHYSAQCPPDVLPTPEEKATDANPHYTTICPEIIATGAGTYGKFLETVTQKMTTFGADGYMLDYECVPPLCYCERCRQAFLRYTGLPEVAWPQDVKKGGPHYRQWIDFRCDQGAQYVKVIGEAARKARPDCPLQAWIAGYDYNGSIESAQIDISKAAEYMTEPEVPHYTLPADYADMWTKDAGIGSVEAGIKTVQDSLNVTSKPIVFCSSVIYPLGAATPWSDPQMLNAQMLAMIGQGVRGISFWGGHDDGSVDGRYLHMLAKWNAVLAAAEPFLWDGKREDEAVTVQGTDPDLVRKYVWLLLDRALIMVVNLTQEDRTVTVETTGISAEGHHLLGGETVSLAQPLTVPALDGVMVVAARQ